MDRWIVGKEGKMDGRKGSERGQQKGGGNKVFITRSWLV